MSNESGPTAPTKNLRERLWEIIFEAETPAGKAFDVALLWSIGLSVLAVMLETVDAIQARWETELDVAEWIFTIFFSIEYVLRLWLSRKPMRYALSFFGIIDLISCLPLYLALFIADAHAFSVVRILRLLRMFRVLKMVNHIRGARIIIRAMSEAGPKITVFFTSMILYTTLAGTVLYFVESGEPDTDFTSIPVSIYYAIVSVTTVGYGDITVTTDLGRFITSLMILSGFAVIAVPTGIVAADFSKVEAMIDETTDACPGCGVHGHLKDARYCRRCGQSLKWHDMAQPPLMQPVAGTEETYRIVGSTRPPPKD